MRFQGVRPDYYDITQGGYQNLLQYYMEGGLPNLLQYYKGEGGSLGTPNLYYVIYGRPLIEQFFRGTLTFGIILLQIVVQTNVFFLQNLQFILLNTISCKFCKQLFRKTNLNKVQESVRLPSIVELCMHFLHMKKIRTFFMLVCHQTAISLLRCFFDSSSLYSFSIYIVLIGFLADIANCLAR